MITVSVGEAENRFSCLLPYVCPMGGWWPKCSYIIFAENLTRAASGALPGERETAITQNGRHEDRAIFNPPRRVKHRASRASKQLEDERTELVLEKQGAIEFISSNAKGLNSAWVPFQIPWER